MRQHGHNPQNDTDINHYFSETALSSQQETLGQVVVEILRTGGNLNRKAICSKLLRRLELSSGADQEKHYHDLIGLLLGRND